MSENCAVNTDPPEVRCGMCGGRCRNWRSKWIECRNCAWSSHDPRRAGWLWRVRVWLGR
jgi:hypothetical protein